MLPPGKRKGRLFEARPIPIPTSVFQETFVRIPLALCAVVFLLPGPTLADDLSGTLKKVQETSVIKLGYLTQSIPFSYIDADGRPNGYSADLCMRVATGIQEQLALQK